MLNDVLPQPPRVLANGERPVILAVDDQPGILELFRLILDSHYEVLDAPDGATALELLHSHHVDLILLDVNLPDTNGLALLERIRSREANVPVILVTILDRAQPALDAIRLGATDYVTKPFGADDLLLRVQRALATATTVAQLHTGYRSLTHRILLIHADPGIRAALAVVLNDDRRIQAVPSLALAIRELGHWVPDLIVVEFGAADGNPARCLAALRSHFPKGRLILITPKDAGPYASGESSQTVVFSEPLEFETLLAEMTVLFATTTSALPPWGRFSARTAQVIQRVARSYPTVTVASLAEAARLSAAHLSRVFHAEVGMALKTFIVRVRIEAAKCLLRETEAKVSEVASQVGFYDGPHLSRTFARYGVGRPRRGR